MSEGSGSRGCRPVERLSVWPLGTARRWRAAGWPTNSAREREALGLSQSAVGKACGWSGVKVSYIENAQQKSITDDDLDKLLPLLEVPVCRPPRLLRRRRPPPARRAGGSGTTKTSCPAYMSDFIGLEQGASLIRTFEPTIMPGLLQTREYMEAMTVSDMVRRTGPPRPSDRRCASRPPGGAHPRRRACRARGLVDESVLHRVVGGPALMADQLDFIVTLMERPNMRFHVFPFERGMHAGPHVSLAPHPPFRPQ